MRSVSAMVCAAVMMAAVPAWAQRPASAPPGTQEIRFGDELVQSSLVRPDTATVRGARAQHGPSLLRVRRHFVPEMLRSVERL